MPLHKQEAYKALKMLVALRGQLPPAERADADRLVEVMSSRLFGALLDMQTFYHKNIVNQGAAVGTVESARSSTLLPPTLDLEWEHQYDVGSSEAAAAAEGEGRKTASTREELIDVEVVRGETGLGMSVSGGVDRPFHEGDTSIVITGIVPDGPAYQTGKLHVGDRIQSVNGISFENITHADAVHALNAYDKLLFLVRHDIVIDGDAEKDWLEPKTYTETIEINKSKGGLGFSIAGGRGSAHLAGDNSIFITKLSPGGTAERDGRLAVGDKIMAVQGFSCENVTHDYAVELLRTPVPVIQLQVEHNAFDSAAAKLSLSLGQRDNAPRRQMTRTGTLRAFGHGQILADESGRLTTEEPVERSVTLQRGTAGFGFDMVGPQASGPAGPGEPVGIYVSRVFKGAAADMSGDVYEGDQICSINGISVLFASFHEALDILRRLQRPVLHLTLRANPPVWAVYRQRMVALQASVVESLRTSAHKETTCVRAYFSYEPLLDVNLTAKERRRQQQMLTVHINDIFVVQDVVERGEWWDVVDVVNSRRGLIPSAARRERLHKRQEATSQSSPTSAASAPNGTNEDSADQTKRKRSRSYRFARRLTKSFRRVSRAVLAGGGSDSADLSRDDASLEPSKDTQRGVLAQPHYERVELRYHQDDDMRPLILLGPTKDNLSDQLLLDYPEIFSACVPHTTRSPRPGEQDAIDYHFVSLEAMSRDIERGCFLEVGQYKGQFYGTSFEAVRSVASRGLICLVDTSVESITTMLEADIQPMVIFLRPASVKALSDQLPNVPLERVANVFEQAEKMENQYSHLLSHVVHNVTAECTFQRTLEAVRRMSREPFWAPLPSAPLPY